MIDHAALMAFRNALPRSSRVWFDMLRLEIQAQLAGAIR